MALDPVTAGFDFAKEVVNKIWPDKTEAEKAQLAAAVSMVQGQLDINRVEASSSSPFTSGWRPFIGWVCGSACAWNWIGLPIAVFACAYFGKQIQLRPADLTEMWPLLLGMLGLGSLRTIEKVKGVA
jgi:hypothetical protein